MRRLHEPGVIVAFAAVLLTQLHAQQEPAFRTSAHGVTVDVSVRNGNRPVPNLRSSDFRIYDNGRLQTIDSVTLGILPIDVTVFLGTNNETAAQQVDALNSDVRRIGALLRPGDRLRLLTLGNRVVDLFGWRNAGQIDDVINVYVGGVQSLYDACFLAMMQPSDPDRRRFIVIMTDGTEFGSVIDSTTVRDIAKRADAVLDLVLVDAGGSMAPAGLAPSPANQPLTRGLPTNSGSIPPTGGFSYLRASWFHVMADERGLERLEEASRVTGGEILRASTGDPIVEIFRRAFEDFRQTYVVRYTVSGVPMPGWHELRVEVAGNAKYTIRARRGYFGG